MNMDDYFRFQREIQKMMEQSAGLNQLTRLDREVREAVESLREPYSLNTALGRAMRDAVRPREIAKEALIAAVPTGAHHLLDTIERQRSIYREHLNIADSRSVTAQLFDRLQLDTGGRFHDLFGTPTANMLRKEIMDVRDLTLGISSPTASAAIATALGGWTNVLDSNDAITRAFANPLAETARHFHKSAAMLAAGPEPEIARAIERSILLADVELRATNDALLFIEPMLELDTTPPAPRPLYVPRLQRIELRRAGDVLDEYADLDDVLAALPVGQVVLVAREVIDLFLELLDEEQGSGRPPIFKMTNRVGRACADLTFTVPLDRRTFADFIDDLYWLFYESPGASSLRYLTEQGGPFTREDCDTVFVIKRLRSYYRHDLEHGSEREIEKKFEAVKEDFRARGVENPRTRADYRALHRVLLEEVADFLRKLRDARSSPDL